MTTILTEVKVYFANSELNWNNNKKEEILLQIAKLYTDLKQNSPP